MAFETVMVKVKFQVYVSPSMAPRFRLSLRVRLWSTKFCGTTGLRTFAKIMNVRLDFTRPNMLPAQLNCGRSTEFWHPTFKFLATVAEHAATKAEPRWLSQIYHQMFET